MEIESGSAGAPVSGAALSRQSADAQTEQRQQLVQFCRSLAQMLQSAEPPSRNAVAEMHKVFQSAMRGRQALSLVAVRTLQDYAIVVDGALDEPVRLAKLLGAGTDDMLVPQLIRQFERAGLFSVTLLGRVALAELTAFVELLTKAGVRDGRELDRRLTEHEVVGIRLLCDADLADADEALGWHTRYLVGRLGKELKRLDRYSETGHGDRGATLAQVIDDIVWSVRRPKPLVDMLLNLDPAVRALQTQPAKLAAAVVSRIPVELAGPALDALAREMSAEQPEATLDRQLALLRLLV
ncbi:MAG: hypothetical protein HY744_18445, partial [Deltaproteobacteria bacterium]|nr:hypothetical protein [Deltaproteobacteria bacterium]